MIATTVLVAIYDNMVTRTVYAWRCGCSKTSQAIEYATRRLEYGCNKIVYACPTIQMEKEVKRKLDQGLVINSQNKTDKAIQSRIFRTEGESGWSLIQKRNDLLKTEKCLIVTHARLMNSDPLDFYDSKFVFGTRDLIIDEYAMKLRRFYIQRPTLLAYIVHPHYEMPKYITYENDFDELHKRRENYWQEWEEDMEDDLYKRTHKIRVSKTLLKNELLFQFPLWFQDFIEDCKRQRLWCKTFKYYQRLCLTFRRTYVQDGETRTRCTDYSKWLWLTPSELKENGLDLSDILGSTYSMLDNESCRWEGKLYSKLQRLYEVFNYQNTVSYIMLLIARQLAKDQYYDTEKSDEHPGYYVGGVNPLERWLLQHMFNVICLDGSATIFKDIYKYYGFHFVDDEEKSIEHYADNLECRIYNFKKFSQTSIQKLTPLTLRRAFAQYIWPFDKWAKCWYVIVPSKCTDAVIRGLKKLYPKELICNCTTSYRTFVDAEGNDQQMSIMETLYSHKNAKFIIVNPEGQLGSNEFLRRCDGVIAISQLNLPKGINKMYSDYYGVANYNYLYNTHLIYQESGRARNRLQKAVNYKPGHKIPFIAMLGMTSDNFKIFNRLNTHFKIFDKNETFNSNRPFTI